MISLLVLCLAFSIGFSQALSDTDTNTDNMTDNQDGDMTPANIADVSLMLQDIQGIRNNNTTGEMWFVYINGEPAKEEFGKNDVTEGDLLSFWYTTEKENGENGDKEVAIENATYVVDVTIARGDNQTETMTGNMTGDMTEPTTDNMTETMTDNMTVNMTDNQTEPMTDNMTGNMTGNVTGPMVLFNNTVSLTEGVFIFTPENSTQSYQADNFTDIGALNATGLQYNVSVMQMEGMEEEETGSMDESETNDNMAENETGST